MYKIFAESPRSRSFSHGKTRCQASHRVTDEWSEPFSGRPLAELARRVSVAMAACRHCSVRSGHDAPERGFNTASTARSCPCLLFSHFASSLLAVASAVLVLPRRRHCRRSAELACASHRCIRQLVALSASPQPSPSFPPCLARDRALGEPLLALRRRGNTLAGVPPWPLLWPYFVGAPQAS